MSNVGYLLAGYDIYASNPMPMDTNPDPGFRSAIFKAEYKGSTTPDYLFCTPEGLSFISCDDSCPINFDSRIILGRKAYSEGLQAKVSELISQLDNGGAFGSSKVRSIQALSFKDGAHSNERVIKYSKCFLANKTTKFAKDSNHRAIKVLRSNHCQNHFRIYKKLSDFMTLPTRNSNLQWTHI